MFRSVGFRSVWNGVALIAVVACLSGAAVTTSQAQDDPFDIFTFDETAQGPWSDVGNTTVTVPLIPFKGIELDGVVSDEEYGGFRGITVTPGENAWLMPWPVDRSWDGPEDSSFTFWLAHDDAYLYVGVDVLDDVVNSDDENLAFWRDDTIEIVTDVWNDNYDINTDLSNDAYGGHSYVNYQGRFSAWDEELEEVADQRWSSEVDWTYGDGGQITGFGEETETGWAMEVRFHKSLFEDEEADIKLDVGSRMGFNIGLDDDDKRGPGLEGDGSRSQDLELQYFWANRDRFFGWNEDLDDGFFSDAEIATAFDQLAEGTLTPFTALTPNFGIDATGRLTHGGAGEIVLGGFMEVDDPPDMPDACDPTTGGDLDGNGTFEFADFLIISSNFGQEVDSHREGDIDCNGKVEFADFLQFSTNFGLERGLSAQPVPEPNGGMMSVLALLLLPFLRSRTLRR